jgi:hydrogenase maturation protease
MDDTPILVIGIGNEYRSDDGAGLAVIRALKEKNLPGTQLTECAGDGLNLIDTWKVAKVVILVDAVSSESEPGTIFRYNALTGPIPTHLSFHSTHTFGVAEAIEIGNTLHQLPPNLLLFGIEGTNFATGTNISSEVENAIQEVVEQVMRVIQTFLSVT